MAKNLFNDSILHSRRTRIALFMCAAVFLALVLPNTALAAAAASDGGTQDTVCGFASTVRNILNAVSIIVVTIAVIFSGYQIAFAHKRIGDVAPVLIGGILIGAASQIATLFLSASSTSGGGTACS